MGLTFGQLFSVLLFLLASTSIIDMLTLLQKTYFDDLYKIITQFTMSIDLRITLIKAPEMEAYYYNIITRNSNSIDLINSNALNDIDLKRLIFVIMYIFGSIKRSLHLKTRIRKHRVMRFVEEFSENFMVAYLTTDLYTVLFQRLMLYKYVD